MIQVLHISAECYPAAKTGGLADVVGSLPKYQSKAGVLSGVVIPKYALKWIHNQEWVTVFGGSVRLDWRNIGFTVQQLKDNKLGYPFFVVDMPELFDRPGIYNDPAGHPYGDEVERYLGFQQAVLYWLLSFPEQDRPKVLHCHDHHTGLIPFMVKHCPEYSRLGNIPTVFTIHNGQYQGMFSWSSYKLLPYYNSWVRGLLDWNGVINPMACALRCAWVVTTVSQSYLYELHEKSMGLEPLFREEWHKQYGIVNGIDADVWDPATDPAIQYRLDEEGIDAFKLKNKKVLCEWFNLPLDQPMISFIGRMVGEKGVDLLPESFKNYLQAGGRASFLTLGTGEAWIQNQFRALSYNYAGQANAVIDFNEALAHQIYAGCDYLIMPSRVEPCGLNQMYAMRYGTIPIVRSVGGLKDTVPDIAEPNNEGRGIRFDQFSLDDIGYAIHRAASMWHYEPGIVSALRKRDMAIDFSWENTVQRYFDAYNRTGANIHPSTEAPAASKPAQKAKPAPVVPKEEPVAAPVVEQPKAEKVAKAKPVKEQAVVVEKVAEKPAPVAKAPKAKPVKEQAEKVAKKAAPAAKTTEKPKKTVKK